MLLTVVLTGTVTAHGSPSLEMLEYLGDSAEIGGEMVDPMLLEAGEIPSAPASQPEVTDVE